METTGRFLHKTKVDIIAIMQCLVQRGFIKGSPQETAVPIYPSSPLPFPLLLTLDYPTSLLFLFLSLHLVQTPSDARKPGSTYET